MFLYLNPDDTYARTKDEAQKGAKKVDVPTDARGLVAHLNLLVETHKGTKASEGPVETFVVDLAPMKPHMPKMALVGPAGSPGPGEIVVVPPGHIPLPVIKSQQASYTATEIEAFILDTATVAQAANILSCLGTRMAELAKDRRAAA